MNLLKITILISKTNEVRNSKKMKVYKNVKEKKRKELS